MEGLREKTARILNLLQSAYGIPEWPLLLKPLDELISTILSQNTNDHNRDVAFTRLKDRFPTWEEALSCPVDQIIDAIRPAGLANQKAIRIQQILQAIKNVTGGLDLEFLKGYSPQETHDWLIKFNGVGLKTVAIVMLFSLGMPAFPVDTHVHRVTQRLGLISEKDTADQAHGILAGLIQPQQYSTAHLNLIRLGREVCHPRNPECSACPVRTECDFIKTSG